MHSLTGVLQMGYELVHMGEAASLFRLLQGNRGGGQRKPLTMWGSASGSPHVRRYMRKAACLKAV